MALTVAAQPICISERMQKYSVEGQRATLVGWGRLAEQTGNSSYSTISYKFCPNIKFKLFLN
jgi:hypothetical protein